ncbi:hypothetical protein HanLR1_Chr07g0244401 [Helianthus annuus]|nr:hypothetical protein HanLR1_Chr07g0244401 [Helianthus annuus]
MGRGSFVYCSGLMGWANLFWRLNDIWYGVWGIVIWDWLVSVELDIMDVALKSVGLKNCFGQGTVVSVFCEVLCLWL